MEEQILALINQTHLNIFLTGKAGTGKTTLLHKIIATSHKNTVVVAPTGIAALNAGGVTIHSMFQLPFASFLPTISNPSVVTEGGRFENRTSLRRHFKIHKNKRQIIENIELLIIDEVSMLRADILDAMDFMLQTVRKNRLPFGGVQVLFIGDLMQLPPVVKNDEWEVLKQYYDGMFFFQAKVIKENPLLYVELEKIYRQSDPEFISLLNNLRDNRLTAENITHLQKYVKPNFTPEKDCITLTTHNAKADHINQHEISKIKSKGFTYDAVVVGDFPEHIYPIEKQIVLKEGARVMFVKNDLSGERLFFNGKMGTVTSLTNDEIWVRLDGGDVIEVEPYEWENVRYRIDETTKDIEQERLGTFTQYPLRLAWAITVHKSQGLTFEKAILDLDKVFASGQAYVAFSRLRSLDGLVLLSPINPNGIENNYDVKQYAENKASEHELENACQLGKKQFLETTVLQCFQWDNFLGQWMLHRSSYTGDIGKKSSYKNWADTQTKKVIELTGVAEKFTSQLKNTFSSDYQISFVYERFEKAFAYFIPLLKEIWYEILRVEGEIITSKKVKQYKDELYDLEGVSSQIIRNLLKTRKIIQSSYNNTDFNAATINASELKEIRESLVEKVKEHLKNKQLFVSENISGKGGKGSSDEKISTYEITLQLWKTTPSITEIAQKRVLTETTVYRHLTKLVETGKIAISEIFPNEKISELSKVFEQEENLSLGNIFDACNGKYTWDELRLFKAHFLSQK
ncbi:helix-turn-helix domain-containing protein [Capnocytophaga sp.]|uniref:helix-turn-helix domain-containing protein n=1 Tax=Capnocytophaga sp. TaxID=44737 RepID=UPI0026DD0592|nr:helix-turn-helix domain-containing protein [Capnocytophaga sp.]MDO5106546.1 helix-turn-helix domain-containing protein [Capnocytophaga sp.]